MRPPTIATASSTTTPTVAGGSGSSCREDTDDGAVDGDRDPKGALLPARLPARAVRCRVQALAGYTPVIPRLVLSGQTAILPRAVRPRLSPRKTAAGMASSD